MFIFPQNNESLRFVFLWRSCFFLFGQNTKLYHTHIRNPENLKNLNIPNKGRQQDNTRRNFTCARKCIWQKIGQNLFINSKFMYENRWDSSRLRTREPWRDARHPIRSRHWVWFSIEQCLCALNLLGLEVTRCNPYNFIWGAGRDARHVGLWEILQRNTKKHLKDGSHIMASIATLCDQRSPIFLQQLALICWFFHKLILKAVVFRYRIDLVITYKWHFPARKLFFCPMSYNSWDEIFRFATIPETKSHMVVLMTTIV